MQVIRTLIAVAITLTGISAQANPDFWRNEWPDTNFDKNQRSQLGGNSVRRPAKRWYASAQRAAAAVAVKRL